MKNRDTILTKGEPRRSPNIKGLYFAGDTIWSVSSMVSDKIYQMVFPLFEKIKKYLRS